MLQQEARHLVRAVVRDLQAHRIAEVALLQLALQRGAQVLDLFLVDEQVGVAGDAELVAAEHVHAGEQLADVGVEHRGQEHVGVLLGAQFARQPDHARQRARCLHDRSARVAAEGIAALEFDGEVQALVEHAREGVGGVEADRRQHRHHLAHEILVDPRALRLGPQAAAQEDHAFLLERGQDVVVEQFVLLRDDLVHLVADALEQVGGGDAVLARLAAADADLLLDAGDADLEELVEVARHDAQETQALEQRHGGVGGLGEHAALELQQGQFAVEEVFGRVGERRAGRVHWNSCARCGVHDYVTLSLQLDDGGRLAGRGVRGSGTLRRAPRPARCR